MATDGWRQVTIHHLCGEAKLNKRYFYESFADLGALAAAVVDELAACLLAIGLETARNAQEAGLATEALAREVMRAVVAWLVDDERRARVLFSEVNDNPRTQAHRNNVIRQVRATAPSSVAALPHVGKEMRGSISLKNFT